MTDIAILGPYVEDEIPEPWAHTFADSDGDPLDLSGFDARITWRVNGGDQVEHPAAVSDPANGEATYEWAEGDLEPGTIRGELTVDNGSNRFVQRFAMRVRTPSGGPLPFP
jgi:hypothetical protein